MKYQLRMFLSLGITLALMLCACTALPKEPVPTGQGALPDPGTIRGKAERYALEMDLEPPEDVCVSLFPDQRAILVNGREDSIGHPPLLQDGQFYLPVAEVAPFFGMQAVCEPDGSCFLFSQSDSELRWVYFQYGSNYFVTRTNASHLEELEGDALVSRDGLPYLATEGWRLLLPGVAADSDNQFCTLSWIRREPILPGLPELDTPLEALPDDLLQSLQPVGAPYVPDPAGIFAPGTPHPQLITVYQNSHVRITTAQLNPMYVQWRCALPTATEDERAQYRGELGAEYISSVELLDRTYGTLRGLRVGDSAERFSHLYGIWQSSGVYRTMEQHCLEIHIKNMRVEEITIRNVGFSFGKVYQ